jgi:hypothetical protein
MSRMVGLDARAEVVGSAARDVLALAAWPQRMKLSSAGWTAGGVVAFCRRFETATGNSLTCWSLKE